MAEAMFTAAAAAAAAARAAAGGGGAVGVVPVAPATAAPQQQPYPPKQQQQQQQHQPLVPIRVDVTSSKQNIRIIETLLMDPHVWPVPLVFERSTNDKLRPTDESIEANVRLLAHQILTDAEVQGMGRTTRHFTGRADYLWSINLQERIMDQLRPQVQEIAQEAAVCNHSSKRKRNTTRSVPSASKNKKTKTGDDKSTTEEKEPAEKKKTEPATTTTTANDSSATTTIKKQQPVTMSVWGNAPQQQPPSEQQQPPAAAAAASTTTTSSTTLPTCYTPASPAEQARLLHLAKTVKESATASTATSSSLIPIRIRMSVNGIRIHDDLYWDPHLHLQSSSNDSSSVAMMNALELARITGKDLNLPDEAIAALAVDICEQIHGSNMSSEHDALLYTQELAANVISAAKKKQMQQQTQTPTAAGVKGKEKYHITAAWPVDARKHATDSAHLVQQHRPATTAVAAAAINK